MVGRFGTGSLRSGALPGGVPSGDGAGTAPTVLDVVADALQCLDVRTVPPRRRIGERTRGAPAAPLPGVPVAAGSLGPVEAA